MRDHKKKRDYVESHRAPKNFPLPFFTYIYCN